MLFAACTSVCVAQVFNQTCYLEVLKFACDKTSGWVGPGGCPSIILSDPDCPLTIANTDSGLKDTRTFTATCVWQIRYVNLFGNCVTSDQVGFAIVSCRIAVGEPCIAW